MNHLFTEVIFSILRKYFSQDAQVIFELSTLLRYVNRKTRSANRGSKSRGSFANLYAIYVLVEDYLLHNFDSNGEYSKYEGADFSSLLQRIRSLPFGNKLQNHALNNRINGEFQKLFPEETRFPIIHKFIRTDTPAIYGGEEVRP